MFINIGAVLVSISVDNSQDYLILPTRTYLMYLSFTRYIIGIFNHKYAHKSVWKVDSVLP